MNIKIIKGHRNQRCHECPESVAGKKAAKMWPAGISATRAFILCPKCFLSLGAGELLEQNDGYKLIADELVAPEPVAENIVEAPAPTEAPIQTDSQDQAESKG